MSTRRGFLSSIAAVAAVVVSGVSFGGAKQVVRTKTRVTLSHWMGTGSEVTNVLTMRCTAPTRRDMVRFVHGVRDSVWSITKRANANTRHVEMYMQSYANVETRHIYRDDAGCWYIDTSPNFLCIAAPSLVEDLAALDIEIVDDCGGKIMRRFKSRTKHGVTRTREVIKTNT